MMSEVGTLVPSKDNSLSIQRARFCVGQQQLLSLMLFACGFFAVQRFTVGPINTIICVLPIALFLANLVRGHHQTALTCLVLALFLSIDNGGNAYAETVAPLRYFIYLSSIGILFYLSKWRIQWKPLLLAVFLGCGLAFGSVTSVIAITPIDSTTLQRDLFVLFLLSAFLMNSRAVKIDPRLLFIGSFGYLVGEVVNASFFYSDFTEYLSYDSLKAFVVFPLIYTLITRRNVVVRVAMAVATLYVIFLYGSRMITLSILLFTCIGLFISSIKHGHGKILLGFSFVVIGLANINITDFLTGTAFIQFKAISFLAQIQENFDASDIFGLLALLDPVRFAEYQLFFSRPLLEILLGSGIGAGIYDTNGALAFVTFDQTAFSDQELSSSTFYSFHDFWIDFGLRFGLLPLAYLLWRLVLREMQHNRLFHGALIGILLLNTTFATSGLLFTALMVKFFPRSFER